MAANSFKHQEIERLANSGWAACPSIANLVSQADLPAVTSKSLERWFGDTVWRRAEAAVVSMRAHFASARFAEETAFGVLLVPQPKRLDTRQALPPEARVDQLGRASPDVFDDRLPPGVPLRSKGPWAMVVTVISTAGVSMGSYDEITLAPAGRFTVLGQDTRRLMTRQLWGARVLQSGRTPPDCEANAKWTFTLFAGEPLVEGQAESGTVLKGHVRFRLGKTTRGIASARVAPALWVADARSPGPQT